MIDVRNPKELLLGYLLGKLSSDECREIDERLLSDELFADLMEEARIDLLDDLTARRLSFSERRRVRRALIGGPLAHSELAFAKALLTLRKKNQPTPVPGPWLSRPLWRWAVLSSVTAVAILVMISYARRARNIQPEISHKGPPPTVQTSIPESSLFTILLVPDRVRGESEIPVFAPGVKQTAIEIQIVLEAAPERGSFQVVCTSHDGLPDLSFKNVPVLRQGQALYLSVRTTAEALGAGIHELRVFSTDHPQKEKESFSFRLHPGSQTAPTR